MKNLFLALAFIFIGSIGFANDHQIVCLDDNKNIDFDISNNKTPVFLASDTELITSLKYQLYQLCIVYTEVIIENETGGTSASATFFFIGVSVNDAHCELMADAAQEGLLN